MPVLKATTNETHRRSNQAGFSEVCCLPSCLFFCALASLRAFREMYLNKNHLKNFSLRADSLIIESSNQHMRKLFVLGLIIALVTVTVAFTNEEPGYKNLKVLSKKTTHEEMDSIMKHFSKALGVKCGFCHVRTADEKWDFASDDNKHKGVSRDMMRMTNKINKKYFGHDKDSKAVGAITCFSCHNGKKEPAQLTPADPDEE
jgi:hypothetical protein